MRFELHHLGWQAFQQLCHTVLREVLGQTVVSFLDTNDGGRDGAFAGSWTPATGESLSGAFVVQCKHTTRRGYSLSKSDLSDEFDKAQRLAAAGRCDVYVLMTNAGLTGSTEEDIAAELAARGIEQTLILGSTWFDETIASTPRLRRLVPRLYGLGDMTQILDERSYEQARAVLDAMRTDLDRLVLTSTYIRSADALDQKGFVLLVGAAATGKTTIAAQLALGAADEFDTTVIKLDSIGDLQHRWNPHESQLFWLDDAFGATQFDHGLAREWVTAIPRLRGALGANSRFVITSRDYIYQGARSHLKVGAFPLLDESEIVVDVAALTVDEREQILYNHMRHGRQPDPFVDGIRDHLESAARHAGFTPELARRLSEPVFTTGIDPSDRAAVDGFLSCPEDFLHDVLVGLGTDAQAALGLIFVSQGWVPSPIALTAQASDLLDRLGSALGPVTRALTDMDGGLVNNVVRSGVHGWTFAHPTMADAYSRLLQTPELFHHFVAGFPIRVLLSTITCANDGRPGAIVVPPSAHDGVLDRLDEPVTGSTWIEKRREKDVRARFLANRCDPVFLQRWLDRDPSRIDRFRHAGLMLNANEDNELAARLHEFGLLPESVRTAFAADLIRYGAEGIDPSTLWTPRLESVLTDVERAGLHAAVRSEVLDRPNWAIQQCTEGWDSANDSDPEGAVTPLRDLVGYTPSLYPEDPAAVEAAERLEACIDDWVFTNRSDNPDDESPARPINAATSGLTPGVHGERSRFEDIMDGRTS